MKVWKKIFHANRDQKKAGVAILISDKIDFKTKAVKRDKEGHYCYSSGGKRTCMPPLETRTDCPGENPEVPKDPCLHWRGIFRFRH